MLSEQPGVRPGLFRLPDDPVASTILIPSFQHATSVRGAFGWFTAGWIGRLAPGLAHYLNRKDATPICFTVAPAFFPAEREAVERGTSMSADEASQLIAQVFTSGRAEATALGRHALACLAWMIAADHLRMRIAIPAPTSNYHPKIWLFEDGRNRVLARGSGNATVRGVADGVEHLDVDVSWVASSSRRVGEGLRMLDDWTQGRSRGIDRIVDLPDAVAQRIIETAPGARPDPDDYARAEADDRRSHRALHRRLRHTTRRLRIPDYLEWRTGTYSHQGKAVAAWERGPISERGIVSMATGAGKTIAALVCATRVQDRLEIPRLLVVISAPSIPLIKQWQDETAKFGITAVAPALEPRPQDAVTRLLRRLPSGGTHIVVVTNNMLCSRWFQQTIEKATTRPRQSIPTMLIGDEAHTLGADSFITNQPTFFQRRLGLSATAERQYDPDGTEQIFEFFGGCVYDFALSQAIGFCLVPYDYYVHAATLDASEIDHFLQLSQRIGASFGATNNEIDDQSLTRLLNARRRIIETAQSKLSLLRAVLEWRRPPCLTKTLIYASGKDPGQFGQIASILTDLEIRWAPVTEHTTANRKLLDRTLATFSQGGTQVLLAKKVLDQGIDIPSIREAFIVASSTVEREWIQRRGRVLRRHPDKPWAMIHDFLALPPVALLTSDPKATVSRIVHTELNRAFAFAAHARNATGENGLLSHLDRIEKSYRPSETHPHAVFDRTDILIAPSTPRGPPW